MKTTDLLKKIHDGGPQYKSTDRTTAKTAFLANLSQALGLETHAKDLGEASMQEQMFFYMGAISTVADVPDEAIKHAHMSMIFPWSRAIISGCLGYDLVTTLGIPESYGAQ